MSGRTAPSLRAAQATLHFREDGTLDEAAAEHLDSTSCASSSDDGGASDNLTVSDVSGVFLVLGVFVVLSLVSWCMRRSPPAKKMKANRRRSLGSVSVEVCAPLLPIPCPILTAVMMPRDISDASWRLVFGSRRS